MFPSAEQRGWIRCKNQLPVAGQIVYYFGPHIGLHIGTFDPTIETKCYVEDENGETVLEDMPEHVINSINHNKFKNLDWGVVDADDAPWWMPYDAKRAVSWVPLPPDYIPEEYREETNNSGYAT